MGRMALNIKDPLTEQRAREVAKQTGESLTKAVRVALQERLRRLPSDKQAQRQRMEEILRRVDALPRVDDRTEDEIWDTSSTVFHR
jgi:antitoxin VapB